MKVFLQNFSKLEVKVGICRIISWRGGEAGLAFSFAKQHSPNNCNRSYYRDNGNYDYQCVIWLRPRDQSIVFVIYAVWWGTHEIGSSKIAVIRTTRHGSVETAWITHTAIGEGAVESARSHATIKPWAGHGSVEGGLLGIKSLSRRTIIDYCESKQQCCRCKGEREEFSGLG